MRPPDPSPRLDKPLTLTEKILYAHLARPEQDLIRGVSQLELKPQVRSYVPLRV